MYTTGWFQDSVDFDPSANSFNLSATPNGYNGYIHKMSYLDVSVKKIDNATDISIYPNPTNGIINIETTFLDKNLKIEVYNNLSELLFEQKSVGKTNQINLSNLSNGIYFIKLISDEKVLKTQKIIRL
jgi:hypothetical protein